MSRFAETTPDIEEAERLIVGSKMPRILESDSWERDVVVDVVVDDDDEEENRRVHRSSRRR